MKEGRSFWLFLVYEFLWVLQCFLVLRIICGFVELMKRFVSTLSHKKFCMSLNYFLRAALFILLFEKIYDCETVFDGQFFIFSSSLPFQNNNILLFLINFICFHKIFIYYICFYNNHQWPEDLKSISRELIHPDHGFSPKWEESMPLDPAKVPINLENVCLSLSS